MIDSQEPQATAGEGTIKDALGQVVLLSESLSRDGVADAPLLRGVR